MDSALIGRRADRTAVYASLASVTALAWIVTVQLSTGTQMRAESMDMAMPTVWHQFLLTAAMWVAMMVGMMVPSATPMIVGYAEWTRRGPGSANRALLVTSFLAGYLLVWSAFSLLAATLHLTLDRADLITAMGALGRPTLGGSLLIVAGLFQMTPWKASCLRACRTPLGFLIGKWRDGSRGALTMGVQHGSYCLGCCWLLMATLFVVGTMHLAWMAAIGVFVLAEKVAPKCLRVSQLAAVVLVGWGAWTLLTAGW